MARVQPKARALMAGQAVIDRILRRCIVTDDDCWEWQGTRVKGGYGRTTFGSRTDGTRRLKLVHRATYEAAVGPIEDGMTIEHVCVNPPCCNPAHLIAMTMRDNTLRNTGPTAINARKTECPKCAGPFTVRANGTRYCRPCLLAYYRAYNAARSRVVGVR